MPLDVKVNKIEQVKRYLRRRFYLYKLINILFPGTVSVLKNSTIKGIIVLSIFGLCVVMIFYEPLFPQLYYHTLPYKMLLKGVYGLLGCVWLISNLKNLLERGGV